MEDLSILFTGGIFFVALASLLMVTLSLGFVWANSRFSKLESGQVKLEKRIDGIEVKLDQLISALKEKKVIKTSLGDGRHSKISL